MHKSDLLDSERHDVFLTCELHPWVRWSADRRDYFWMADDDTFGGCDICDSPLVLAREDCTIEVLA